jgi:hypothetical protein
MMVLVHDSWTGAIKICGPGGQDCLFSRPAPPARVVTFDDDLLSQKPERWPVMPGEPPVIVTTEYRYKRPPRKKQAVPLAGSAITTVKRTRSERKKPSPPPPANDDEKPPPKQPAILTTRPKRGQFGEVEDLTPEEHQRRGDAADELFRELARRATGA